MDKVTDKDRIDPQVYDLYDEYCHSMMDRREFFRRAAALAVVGGSGLLMARALLPDYAAAQMISFTDKRIKARYVEYDSPGGNSGKMRGYLVQPAGSGPFPAVVVIHENRGLNPHIEDVARRAAVAGSSPWRPTVSRRSVAIPAMTTRARRCSGASIEASCAPIFSTAPSMSKPTRYRTGNWGLPASALAAAWSISLRSKWEAI